jgi:hypothetical protein
MRESHQDRGSVALWFIVGAMGVHFIEEYALDFTGWVAASFSMPLSWQDFHLVNASITAYAIGCAAVGWRHPGFSLSLAALVGANGLFHLAGSPLLGYSPGAWTGTLLFLPLAALAYADAARAGVLTRRVFVLSAALGLLWHAYLGIVFYFKYCAVSVPRL